MKNFLVTALIPLVVGLTSISLPGESAWAAQDRPPTGDPRPSIAPMLKEVTPAVVNIAVEGRAQVQSNPLYEDPLFRRFFGIPEQGLPEQRTQSVGSGVIINADKGYILTNHHVVNNADTIMVTLQDKRQLQAKLLGSDSGTDIALLQIEAEGLQDIPLGDSDSLQVGDFVVAIGNPFGLGQSVTSGIVSALGRSGMRIEDYEDFIQTDASVNPGNSGGALVDYSGKLVGINTAIISPAGGNVGIGFAIPINMADSITEQLLSFGEVRRGVLGVRIGDVTPDVSAALALENAEGAVVVEVMPDSAAAKAGLQVSDVILAVNGNHIENSNDLRNRISLIPPGAEVDIRLLREGNTQNISLTLGGQGEPLAAREQSTARLQGAQFRDLTQDHPQYGRVQGVEVSNVLNGSPAWNQGLRSADIILQVNTRAVRDLDDLMALLDRTSGTLALTILRGEQRRLLFIR